MSNEQNVTEQDIDKFVESKKIESKYENKCKQCGTPYTVGDTIYWLKGVATCKDPDCFKQTVPLEDIGKWKKEQEQKQQSGGNKGNWYPKTSSNYKKPEDCLSRVVQWDESVMPRIRALFDVKNIKDLTDDQRNDFFYILELYKQLFLGDIEKPTSGSAK